MERVLRPLGLHACERVGSALSALTAFVSRLDLRPGDDPLEDLRELSDALNRSFHYVPGSTSVVSSIEHILESRRGVCQDYAHVMIAIARSWGPARPLRFRIRARDQQG